MSGSTLVESPMMMNMSLSCAASRSMEVRGTPPVRRRRHESPAAFMAQCGLRDGFRDGRSPSPAAYPESILRHKKSTESCSSTATCKKSSQSIKLCQTRIKISSSSSSSPAILSSQISQISLSTGTAGLESHGPDPVSLSELADRLQAHTDDSTELFILDCRSFISFNLKKIRGALNVCCTDRCSRRRLTSGKSSILDMVKGTDEEKESFKKYLQSADVILYDDNTSELDGLKDTNNTLQLVGKVLQLQGATVKYLKGGLDAFQQKYDSLCVQCAKPCKTPLYSPTSASIQEPAIDTATASQILPFLYLGNERDAANEDRLRELGITHVLNVTAHIPFFPEQQKLGLTCKRLPASDSGQQNLRQYFHTAATFIDEVRESSGRVLVHCQAGVSRSATVTLAYLMYHTTMTLHEAFALLKSRRAIVSPNFNFMGQLYSLEQALEKGEEERKLSPPLDLHLPNLAACPPTPAVLEVPQTPFPKSVSTSSISDKGFRF